MAELNFLVYKADQDVSITLGNDCYTKASMSLVYDDDGARGKFGNIQSVIKNSNMAYEYVILKYNTDFDFSTGGEVTLNGISLKTGDHVYLSGQTTPSENGIYTVSSGSWSLFKNVDSDIFIDLGARAIDTTDGDLTRNIVTYKPNLDFGTVGFYTIFYYVVNSFGVLSKKIRKVKVTSSTDSSIVPTNSFIISHYKIKSDYNEKIIR